MATAKEEDKEAKDKLRAARGSHIIRDRTDRAKAVLEPYRRCPETDIESAIRNFFVDFFHLTREHKGAAMEAETLKVLVDEAAELYSDEEGVSVSGIGTGFEVTFQQLPPRGARQRVEEAETETETETESQ